MSRRPLRAGDYARRHTYVCIQEHVYLHLDKYRSIHSYTANSAGKFYQSTVASTITCVKTATVDHIFRETAYHEKVIEFLPLAIR